MQKTVYLSEIDESRFGFPIARANHVTMDKLPEVLDFCAANNVRMLIARCPSNDLTTAQAMEQDGFRLMDTLVYYACNLKKKPIPALDPSPVIIRPVRPEETDRVQEVARGAFQGYYGHYHADPRLDRAKSDEAYVSWAVRSCTSREVADEVLVAELDGTVAGFATLRMNSPEEGEGVLFAIAPEAQGHGIYRLFMVSGMHWCAEQGAERMVVSTQITNIAVQKVWCRVGFEPSYSFYTFHKWFDED